MTKALGTMNKQMNMPKLQKIMTEFVRENEKADMTQEMIGVSESSYISSIVVTTVVTMIKCISVQCLCHCMYMSRLTNIHTLTYTHICHYIGYN